MHTKCNQCIFVVEDSDIDFEMIREGIHQAGISNHVKRATEATEARRWLESERGSACLMLMDLNLPGGENGHDLLRLFKKHPMHRTMPIIVFSTSASAQDIAQCYEAGANSYHTKPLETPRFHSLVKQIAHYWFEHAIVLGAVR